MMRRYEMGQDGMGRDEINKDIVTYIFKIVIPLKALAAQILLKASAYLSHMSSEAREVHVHK